MSAVVEHIASGSSGNAVLISDGRTRLLFDAGLPYSKLARKIKFSEISGTLITHEHGDHIKAVPELLKRGRPVYMSEGTAIAKGINELGPMYVKAHEQIEVGSFKVYPFDVKHDAAEPLGFLFESTHTHFKGVYITDTSNLPYRFKGVTHWIVECNYAEDILENGSHHPALKNRIRQSHFSIEGLKKHFAKADLSKTKKIILIHLSDSNSDEARFVNEIQALTGIPTYAP